MAKRHHYVPVTYLKNFTDASGYLHVFRKDDPRQAFRQRPESTGFERYYYSQFDKDGARDDDLLEAIFSEIESDWPNIVAALSARETNFAAEQHFIPFLSLMRVRVPAFRDLAEMHLSHSVHTQALIMHAAGKLSPPPEGHENLMEKIHVTIDPQSSLEMMAHALTDIGQLFATLNFDVLHNVTDEPFLTSDNPVIYFDPQAKPQRMLPYMIRPDGGPLELLFPVSSAMVLRGRTRPQRTDIGHRSISDRRVIAKINRLICRFAYRTVFAGDEREAQLIANTAPMSPVGRFDRVLAPGGGYASFSQLIFGPRPNKPKWDTPRE